MARLLYRYEVPVDGRFYMHRLTSDPVEVQGNDLMLEFWAEHDTFRPEHARTFCVFGTGQPIPDSAKYIGTCPRTPHGFVWHLYEVNVPAGGEMVMTHPEQVLTSSG